MSRGRAEMAWPGFALAAVLALSPSPVLADEVPEDPELVPAECMPYWTVVGGSDSAAAWNQVLSFAACVQDTSITRIEDADQLPELVARYEAALVPAVKIYVAALEYGPAPIQLRAAFQIGMSQVALLTRARASIVAPSDRAKHPAAAARDRALRSRLEPLLEKPSRLAWMLFALIDRVVSEDPSIASDEVTRYMVRSARELELSLRWSIPVPSDEIPTSPVVAAPR